MNTTETKPPFVKQRGPVALSETDFVLKKKEEIEKEIERIKALHNADVENRLTDIRQKAAIVSQDREKLEASKKEFELILTQFKKEKEEFERQKQTILDLKEDAKKTMERAGAFIVAVRNLAQGL